MGAGPGMGPKYYQEYAPLVGGKVRAQERRAHSLYLELAAETGVVGLFAFLLVIVMVLHPLDEARRRTRYSDRKLWGLLCGLELAMLVFLTTSVFLHAAYIRYCWLLLALSVAAALLPQRRTRGEFLTVLVRNSRGELERRVHDIPTVLALAGRSTS